MTVDKSAHKLLLPFLIANGFSEFEVWEENEIVVYDNNLGIMIMIINPHEGTDYRYVVRFDINDTFDRWANCLDEIIICPDKFDLLIEKVTAKYQYIISHPDSIIENGGGYK